MEWAGDFECSPFNDMFELLSSPPLDQMEPKSREWTIEENKAFENALAEIGPNSPGFLENVASKIPWKSMEDVKSHYQALLEDIEMIESGKVPIPDYRDDLDADQAVPMIQLQEQPNKKDDAPPSNTKTKSTSHQRRRGIPWTEEEHQLFLMGLNKYGKGDWRSISRYYVISKTPTQVASHAQKYFRRQTSSTPADRRRPSIHDIQTVTPSPIPIPPRASIDPNFALISPAPLNPGGMFMAPDMMYNNPSMMSNNYPNMMMNNNISPNFGLADAAIFNGQVDGGAGPSNASAYASPSSVFMYPYQQYWG